MDVTRPYSDDERSALKFLEQEAYVAVMRALAVKPMDWVSLTPRAVPFNTGFGTKPW